MLSVAIQNESLTPDQIDQLQAMWRRCARRIILATTLAESGHPGGSLSSLHVLLVLYSTIRHRPEEPRWAERDRVVVSMGHISPGVYSVLCEFGYLSEERFLLEFRRAGSACAGHVEQGVPGVEWNTGNLGQGLSVGTGLCLAQDRLGRSVKTVVLMGDGEQQKGQIAEARRFAVKFGQGDLIGIVDRNHLQIGGCTEDVMPVRVREEYAAAGWNVLYVADGHDFQAIFRSLRRAWNHEGLIPGRPTVLVARTIMGKGISFMENKAKFHGSTLGPDDAGRALEALGFNPAEIFTWQAARERHHVEPVCEHTEGPWPAIDPGEPIVYGSEARTDCRSAFGAALKALAEANNKPGAAPKIIGFSCDLEGSVKMQGLRAVSPHAFVETGIQEHHAAACSAAVSREGLVSIFSTFGVFAVAETYNQHRLSDLNEANIKVVATHLGLDVGEDGPTHQCIDYFGLLRNLFGFSIFVPADPNQTDRIIRYVVTHPGNHFVGMGRSKVPVVTREDGLPFFGPDHVFQPGRADWLRRGDRATFLTYGAMVPNVLDAHATLRAEGLAVGVLNMASLKPLDKDAVLQAADTGPLVTVEDHVVHTGLGAAVAQLLSEAGVNQRVLALGATRYGSSGRPSDLYRIQGLDASSVTARMRDLLAA